MIRRVFSYNSTPETELRGNSCVLLSFSNNGFNFLKYAEDPKRILSIDEFQFDHPILDFNGMMGEFKAFTSDFLADSNQSQHLTACINTEAYTLVPDELFDSDRMLEYLSFSGINPLNENHISVNDISTGDFSAKLIISPTDWQMQFVQETFPQSPFFFDIAQFSTNVLKRNDSQKAAYIHVSESHYDLILTENNTPILINRFKFSTAKEFCYYIIGSLNSFAIDPYTTQLFISGDILPGSEIGRASCRERV